MNYSLRVNNEPNGRFGGGGKMYNISREGNTISVEDQSAVGRRHRGDDYSVTLTTDTVSIRSGEKNFDIQMSPEGVTVSDISSRNGLGNSPISGFSMALRPEQYESTGLSVASSLIGIPLIFPQV